MNRFSTWIISKYYDLKSKKSGRLVADTYEGSIEIGSLPGSITVQSGYDDKIYALND